MWELLAVAASVGTPRLRGGIALGIARSCGRVAVCSAPCHR
ncbi:MAG: hypothetical protein ACLTSX_02045 [Collinsella sp.]